MKNQLQALDKLRLGPKLNLILGLVFVIIVVINGLILSEVLQKNAERDIESQALLLIETMGAVRDYTSNQINPELASRLETEDQFLPQTVPGYSAREVFENLRKREQYSEFLYKEATLNPTNLRDKADAFETKIVEDFRKQPQLKQLSGFRSFPGGDMFYVARPIAASKQQCLRCHSTPAAAPKSQLTTYGSDNGFGWKLNETVGAKIVLVPASKILTSARQLQLLVMGILAVGCLLVIFLLNLFLKFSIINPITRMSQWSQQVSVGVDSPDFKHPAKDEIGVLAAAVNRLKVSLEMAMNMLNQPPDE